MAKKILNQTCKVCKFHECHYVNVPLLVGEMENDNNQSSNEGGICTNKSCRNFQQKVNDIVLKGLEEGYNLSDTRYQAWLCIHHPNAVNSETPIYLHYRNQAFIPNLTRGPTSNYVTWACIVGQINLNSIVQYTGCYKSIGTWINIFWPVKAS